MSDPLKGLVNGVAADPGLKRNISERQMEKGLAAARELNDVLMWAIEKSGVNNDGLLTGKDMATVSATIYAKPAKYVAFLEAHGNDNGDVVSGFHYVQGDGGTLRFQGRDFVDTVADAIYHYGFKVTNGRYVNEDGAANETAADVAGWLNYFLNGKNAVLGTKKDDVLHSGDYSTRFYEANREWFYAGDGDDKVWAGRGSDRVYAGEGRDTVGGDTGHDKIWGGVGRDKLYGQGGDDQIWGGRYSDIVYGGEGDDTLYGNKYHDTVGGGDGADIVYGGRGDDRISGDNGKDIVDGGDGNDLIYGGSSSDRLIGGDGNDEMHGSSGHDRFWGGAGSDTLYGGAGRDRLEGGKGRDHYKLWEQEQERDVLIFDEGHSGRKASTIDYVEGFNTSHDKIDLSDYGGMVFKKTDFAGKGNASVYFDGRYLRIDDDGDRATDMMIEFRNVSGLSSDNFIF